MIDSQDIILPSEDDIFLNKSRCGISFAVKTKVTKFISFRDALCEDYMFLKEMEFRKYKIVLSPFTCYFVRTKYRPIKELKRILFNFNKKNNEES